jgi:predicted dehydrogenase
MSNALKDPLPVAVIGCGRMGRLHARVYSQMPRVKLVGVCDADLEAASAVAEEFGGTAYASAESLPSDLAAVTIAVPTKFHLDIALPLLKRGVACLIEKPLAESSAQGRKIVDAGRDGKALIQVGHIERFNPAVRAMGRLGIKPRFMEVTRISPLTFRSIDVGVVLDMMIHDIDIILQLANSTAVKIDAVGVSVIGQVEDICNARITFANGCVANLTASRLAMKTERKLRVFSMDAYVSIDYQKKYGIVVRRTGNVDSIRDTVARIKSGEIEDLSQLNFADLVNIEELQIDDIEPLRAELDSFVDAVTGQAAPPITGEDGLAAVELAERIVEAVNQNPLGTV